MSYSLSKQSRRGFWALIVTQFQGAFNDNIFKFLVIFFLVDRYAAVSGHEDIEGATQQMVAMTTILFSLPFIIFPGLFGGLSDRYSKKSITVWSKYAEVGVMALGVAAFYVGASWGLWVLLFAMATQSAFFSPSKYGILPEILPETRLSWGNGILGFGTMLAIIGGVGAAGPVYDMLEGNTYVAGVLLAMLSMLGVAASYGITKPPAANPARVISPNPWAGMGEYFGLIFRDRILLVSMIGYCYFWFAGAFLQGNLITYSKVTLELSNTQSSMLQAFLAVGIGVGSIAAGYMSRRKIELGLVPLGMFGVVVTTALLSVPASPAGVRVLLVLLGASAGMFNVPLAAMVQHRAPAFAKGGAMATANVLTFSAMLVAGGLLWGLSSAGFTTRHIFLMTGLLTLALSIFLMWSLRYFIVRFVIWPVCNLVYRVRTVGGDNIPATGGVLLISNHLSFMDSIIIAFATDRPVSFLIFSGYYDAWWMWPIKKCMNVIPISSSDAPGEVWRSVARARGALEAGEMVCIFAEGGISRTGELLSFQKGYLTINRKANAPIVPCHIDNMWGSIFSNSEGRFFWKMPSSLFRQVTVRIGEPMAPDAPPPVVRNAVQDLATESLLERPFPHKLLHRAFISNSRRNLRKLCIADARSGALSRFRVLTGSIILAKKLKPLLGGRPMVSLLLPPSVGGALANAALQLMGKTAVNLNYTASGAVIASCAGQCETTHCITAKAFLERLPVEVPGTPVYLEDIMKTVKPVDRITGMLWALFAPKRLIEWRLGGFRRRSENDLAAVIFSSGSEGEPKGAMLTHRNVLGNVTQFIQVFPYKNGDVMMAFLPLFHSFGFTATLWAPFVCGVSSVFHPSPLEPKAMGELIFKYKAKFLISTPTFLQNFTRRCSAEELASLEFVICGAEKLTARVRDAFKEKFGVEPLEGYGTTECSPVVAVAIPDVKVRDNVQIGTKPGSVGRPVPGMSVRTIDTDTGELLEHGEPGLLQVRGVNVMKGYLNQPEKTAQVLQDGWYSTGDIVSIDEDGFIFITDRFARFSKIAGEMVPHGKVEEVLHELLSAKEQVLAVAGVADAMRGERLVVLHTLPSGLLEELKEKLSDADLPNLWKPRVNAFHRVDAIPVLGTGKMDLKAVKQMAASLDTG